MYTTKTDENVMASTQASTSRYNVEVSKPCNYVDCITGRAFVPTNVADEGVFTIIMIVCMSLFMVTFNGVYGSGLDFFADGIWMYSMVICVSFLVHISVGANISRYLEMHVAARYFKGTAQNVVNTIFSNVIPGFIIGVIMTMLVAGPNGFVESFMDVQPRALVVSTVVNFFLIAPAVKMLWNNVLQPTWDVRITQISKECAIPWTFCLGC